MLLRTPLLRGRLALPLLAAMLLAHAFAPQAPAPLARLELVARDMVSLSPTCSEASESATANWRLTRTPLDLPANRRQRQAGCRRA